MPASLARGVRIIAAPRGMSLSGHGTVAYDGERCPEQRVGVSKQHRAGSVPIAAAVNHHCHRLAQRFRTRECWIRRLPPEQIGDEFTRRI